MLRLVPALALGLLLGPIAAGLAFILLPAFGWLPALGGTAVSLDPFRAFVALPGIGRSILLALWTGLLSTAISVALVLLFLAAWRDTRPFRLLERLLSPLLALPHAAAAVALAFLLAPSGLLFRLLAGPVGWTRPPDLLTVHDPLGLALVAGLVAKEAPFLFLMALAALPDLDASRREEVGRSLGYGRIAAHLHAVLPLLWPRLRLPVLAVAAFATSVVDMALVLGPTTPAPLAVRILDLQSDPALAARFTAAAGAVLQCGVTLAALLLVLLAERLVVTAYRIHGTSGRRHAGDRPLRFAALLLAALPALALLIGIGILCLSAFAGPWPFPRLLPERFTGEAWGRLAGDLRQPLLDTLLVGVGASFAALALSLGALENEARNEVRPTDRALLALYAPLLVPQIGFLFGLQFAAVGLGVDGSRWTLLLAHLVFVLPYVLLSLAGPFRRLDPRYATVARTLGSGPDGVFWRVRLPLLARPVLTALGLGFAVSVGLYLPTFLVAGGRIPTIATETVALASGGARRLGAATALVQAALPFIGFLLVALAARRLGRPAGR